MNYTQDILAAKKVNYDLHESLFEQGDLYYLLNGDISDYSNSGNLSFISNVASNELCYRFLEGSKYHGSIKLDKEKFLLFLSTPTSSQIILFDALACVDKVLVDAPCLDFKNEISGVYKKIGRNDGSGSCDTEVYFVECDKPMRHLNINDCFPTKKISDCEDCHEVYSNEFDCDAIKFNKDIEFPCIKLTETTTGNIPNGNYQVAMAYTSDGVRYSDYFIHPEILKVHSNNKQTFGISVSLTNCTESFFDEYELILISQRADRAASPQRIGFFNTSQREIFIDTLDETFYTPISNEVILSNKTFYESASNIAVNTESLVLSGLKLKKDFDYRLLAQQIGVEWLEVSVVPEDAHKYKSFMRDEVYAFDIAFIYNDGSMSHRTHIPNINPNRTITLNGIEYDALDDAPSSLDHPELTNNPLICDKDPKKIFEIYNTSIGGSDEKSCIPCSETLSKSGPFAYWESNIKYPDDYPRLGCTPIKHFKFPTHCHSHIHSNQFDGLTEDAPCSKECINIMTARFRDIPKPLDCDGNEIPVKGYVIYTSNRDNHKSILHKGLLFNTRNYEEGCETVQFANYPFNDLKEDKFLVDRLRRQATQTGNFLNDFNYDKYTYHSPDIHYVKGGIGTELKLYTNEVGRVRGDYHYTEDFPKYQLLSPFGRLIAQSVGIIEGLISLYGEKCKTTTVETVCKQLKDRLKEVKDFPTQNITGDAITGGASGTMSPGTLAMGTGPTFIGNVNYTNNGGGGITTNDPDLNEYSELTIGDPPCDGTPECDEWMEAHDDIPCIPSYTVISCDLEEFGSQIPIPLIGNFLNTELCKLTVETDAPSGVALTLTFEGVTTTATTNSDGTAVFEFSEKCDELRDAVGTLVENCGDLDIKFKPGCGCSGDSETRVTEVTTECESRIDFINDKDWFERLPVLFYYYSQGISAARNFLKSVTKPKNYAIQYTATADYNAYTCCGIEEGNCRRLIQHEQYLQPINQYVNEQRFHNWCSERADYIELDSALNAPCVDDCTRILHKDVNCGDGVEECKDISSFEYCTELGGNRIQASSYYVGVKRYNPNQYGNLNDYITRQSSCVQTNWEVSDVIYGGDVYITKMSMKRKMPFFNRLPLGLPNNTEFNHTNYFNLAYPRYWMNVNQESAIEDAIEDLIPGGNLLGDYNLENVKDLGKCMGQFEELLNNISPAAGIAGLQLGILQFITDLFNGGGVSNPFQLQGLFYTHTTGIANFWVESEFINDFREYNEAQPSSKFYPIEDAVELADATEYHLPEQFLYDLQYHWKGVSKQLKTKYKDSDFNKDCCSPCDVVCGDRLVYSLRQDDEGSNDNWLNFLPLNYQKLPTNTGDFTGMVEIDDYNLFLAFEDGVYVTQQDEGLLTEGGNRVYLGTFNGFQRRLKRLSADESGYTGCIDKDSIITTRYGVFWFDRKRKKFFNYSNQLADLTGSWQSWFNEFLSNDDRNKNEIVGTYDGHSDRLFFTNKVKKWTISFNPKTRQWNGHHSFIAEEYIPMSNNFLSLDQDKKGIWKHNKKNDYQTYYNEFYPFELGAVLNNKFKDNKLQSLRIYAEYIKYKSFGCKIWEEKFFDKMFIHNSCGTTGMRELYIDNPNSTVGYNNPKNSKTAVRKLDCQRFTFNEFTKAKASQPYFCLNTDGCTYSLPAIQPVTNYNTEFGSISGDWYKLHLIADNPANRENKIITKIILAQNDELIQ